MSPFGVGENTVLNCDPYCHIAPETFAGLEGDVEVWGRGSGGSWWGCSTEPGTRTSQKLPPTCHGSLSKPGVGGAELKVRSPRRDRAYKQFLSKLVVSKFSHGSP